MAPFANTPPLSIEDPSADDWTRGFWDAAAEQQLVAARCTQCGTYRMPPGRFCRSCGSQESAWEPLPGTGTVFTCTIVRSGATTYAPAVVDPDGAEGIRFVSAVVDCDPDDVHPGMAVEVVFERVNDELTVPYWRPARS